MYFYHKRPYLVSSSPPITLIKLKKANPYQLTFGDTTLPRSLEKKIVKLIKRKQVIIGCDGSVKHGVGAYVYGILNKEQQKSPLIQYLTPLHGDLDQSTPLRAEMMALLGERHADSFGVSVKRCHADNGRFADQSFQENIDQNNQVIKFCVVGTHHQNGISERRIRALRESSRTYLAHTTHRWPPSIASKCVSTILWSFAIKYAQDILNTFNFDKQGLTPIMKFAQIRVSRPYLHDLHTFGCPAFVLNSSLQSGNKIPCWEDRVMSGVYLGRSSQQAGNVSLILNLKTGYVSPQFYVVFDYDFTTVEALTAHSEPESWECLCKA